MAGTDLITVTKQFVNPVDSTTTNGLEERITLDALMLLLPDPTTSGKPSVVTTVVAPAACAVPLADLTAAANAINAIRTALLAAGVFTLT